MSATIHFHVSESVIKQMTEEEYESIERAQDGEVRMYRLRPLMARFVVDENGNPVVHSVAMKLIGGIQMDQMAEITKGFFEAMKGAAIPKESAPSS